MNIGRTVRVFRAEPVVSPVPVDVPEPPAATVDEVHVPVGLPPPPVEIGRPVPVRSGR